MPTMEDYISDNPLLDGDVNDDFDPIDLLKSPLFGEEDDDDGANNNNNANNNEGNDEDGSYHSSSYHSQQQPHQQQQQQQHQQHYGTPNLVAMTPDSSTASANSTPYHNVPDGYGSAQAMPSSNNLSMGYPIQNNNGNTMNSMNPNNGMDNMGMPNMGMNMNNMQQQQGMNMQGMNNIGNNMNMQGMNMNSMGMQGMNMNNMNMQGNMGMNNNPMANMNNPMGMNPMAMQRGSMGGNAMQGGMMQRGSMGGNAMQGNMQHHMQQGNMGMGAMNMNDLNASMSGLNVGAGGMPNGGNAGGPVNGAFHGSMMNMNQGPQAALNGPMGGSVPEGIRSGPGSPQPMPSLVQMKASLSNSNSHRGRGSRQNTPKVDASGKVVPGSSADPNINEAMEKLCETMRRSAMSRNLVKQLSGKSVNRTGSARSLSRSNSGVGLRKQVSGNLGGMIMGVDDGSGRGTPTRTAPIRRLSDAKHRIAGRAAPGNRGAFRANSMGSAPAAMMQGGQPNFQLQLDDQSLGNL